MLSDVSAQFALRDGLQEGLDFILLARDQELDPAIAQVPHGAGDIESLRDLPDGIAKTNALDVSFVRDLSRGDHTIRRLIRHFARGNL